MSEPEEWVTIGEAAKRLNIAPRQVRRYADRLIGTEDRTPEGTVPVRVLIRGVLRVKNEIAARGHSLGTEDSKTRDKVEDSVPLGVPSQGATPNDAELNALKNELALLRAERVKDGEEIAFLRSELTSQREAREIEASELRRLMLMDRQELLELRQRVAIGEAPKAEATDNTRETPEGTQKQTSGGWWTRLWKGKG